MVRGWQSTLLGLTTAALLGIGIARADEPIKIGFAIAQSGFMSAYDTPGFKAAVLKIEEINAAGGLMGRKIEYSVSDTKTEREQSAKAGAEMVQKGVDLLIISADYDFGAPAGLAAKRAGIVAFSLGAADPKMGVQGVGPFVFTANGAAQVEGINMAEWAYKKKAFKRAYVLEDQTIEYSKSGCAGFRSAWKKLGGELAGGDVLCDRILVGMEGESFDRSQLGTKLLRPNGFLGGEKFGNGAMALLVSSCLNCTR